MFSIHQHLLQPANFLPSPNCDDRPSPDDVSLLVIHNISLPPGQFGNRYIEDFFCNQLDCTAHPYFDEIKSLRVSSHLLIKRRGEVVQFVPFDRRAWHAGQSEYGGRSACNDFSIGIELEGADDQEFTVAQYQQLAAIINTLLTCYSQLSRDRIVGHSDIAPGRKTDPGPLFDWHTLNRFLSQG